MIPLSPFLSCGISLVKESIITECKEVLSHRVTPTPPSTNLKSQGLLQLLLLFVVTACTGSGVKRFFYGGATDAASSIVQDCRTGRAVFVHRHAPDATKAASTMLRVTNYLRPPTHTHRTEIDRMPMDMR